MLLITKYLFKVLTISTTEKIAAVLIRMGRLEVKMKLLFNKARVCRLLIMMLETELAGVISNKKSLLLSRRRSPDVGYKLVSFPNR